MNIIYVEDNDQNYRLVMRMLMRDKEASYELSRAEDGLTGVKLITEMVPDLILMDINLPDIDGLEVTRRVKENSALEHIPIIALTANAMVGDQERILAAGCDGYLRKPVSRTELSETLQKFRAQIANGKPAANAAKANGKAPTKKKQTSPAASKNGSKPETAIKAEEAVKGA